MYQKYVQRRNELGMNDYQVAQKSGIHASSLSEWKKHFETGGEAGYCPKIDKLVLIANALDCKVDDLIN